MDAITAVEAFDRRTGAGTYMGNAQYARVEEVLAKAIPDSVGSDHAQALRSRIHYGYEFSLRKRMEAIADHWRDVLSYWEHDIPKFASEVADTRNYYAHYDRALEKRAAGPARLDQLSRFVRMLFECLYLSEMGLEHQDVFELVRRVPPEYRRGGSRYSGT